MDIVAISDVHGDIENLLTYFDKINELKFDVIVCAGDLTDINTPKNFTQEDIAKLIIEEIRSLRKPFFVVPGNMDTERVIKIMENEGVSIHGKGKVINKYGFYGFGGAKTPFNTNTEPTEEELKSGLNKAWENVKDTEFKIQVTHNPPIKTKLDILPSGMHVGSNVVRQFIENNNPILAISGHIHEAKGTDKLKNTVLVNPGRLPEGYFSLINIKNGVVTAKILDVID